MVSNNSLLEPETLPGWEQRLRAIVLVVARLGLAYLFFSQLFWKVPPTFGCPEDFRFTTVAEGGQGLQRSSGLCDWLGIQEVYAGAPRPWLATNLDNAGDAEISVGLGLPARVNGILLRSVFMPGIHVSGWLVWLAELIIFLSLFFGVLSRLGGLVAIVISGQLLVGLAGIPNPYEWEWTYNTIFLLSLLMFAFAPGRVFGVDVWLRPRLRAAHARGQRLAGWIAWLT